MYNDCILTSEQAELSIRRIAYQIYEDNTKEDKVIIAGVVANGNQVAESIAKILRSISDLEVIDCQIQVNKKNPHAEIQTSINQSVYKNCSVIIAVSYTHLTLPTIYSV